MYKHPEVGPHPDVQEMTNIKKKSQGYYELCSRKTNEQYSFSSEFKSPYAEDS